MIGTSKPVSPSFPCVCPLPICLMRNVLSSMSHALSSGFGGAGCVLTCVPVLQSSYKPVDKGVPYAKDESAGP